MLTRPSCPSWFLRKGPGPPPPHPTSAEQPWRLLHVPHQGWESGAKEEGSKRTEEACSLPRPGPLSSSSLALLGKSGTQGAEGRPER